MTPEHAVAMKIVDSVMGWTWRRCNATCVDARNFDDAIAAALQAAAEAARK